MKTHREGKRRLVMIDETFILTTSLSAAFDSLTFFNNVSASSDVTELLVEVKQRVEIFCNIINELVAEQASDVQVELDLSWRMAAFLEPHVRVLHDPSGELRSLVQVVKDNFESAQKTVKQMETTNRRLRNRNAAPQQRAIRPLEVATSSGDARADFAARERARAQRNRLSFERKRANSRAQKMRFREEAETSLSRPLPTTEDVAAAAAVSSGESRRLSGSPSMGKLDSIQRRAQPIKLKNLSQSQSYSHFPSSQQQTSSWQSAGESSPNLERLRRSTHKMQTLDAPPRQFFGRHRMHSRETSPTRRKEPAPVLLASLVSPVPSPPPSPDSVHLKQTITSPLLRRRNNLAFKLGYEGMERLREELGTERALFLNQCAPDCEYSYAVVALLPRKQVGWASVVSHEKGNVVLLEFYGRDGEVVWSGEGEKVFQNRSLSDDDMRVTSFEWMDLEHDTGPPDAFADTSDFLLIRLPLQLGIQNKPLPPKPQKELPPTPVTSGNLPDLSSDAMEHRKELPPTPESSGELPEARRDTLTGRSLRPISLNMTRQRSVSMADYEEDEDE